MITVEEVKKIMPTTLRSSITQEYVDAINNISADPLFAEQYAANFISYVHVMKDGKFKVNDYLSAVAYVSYKLMGYTNEDAYAKTFPQRYQALLAKGTSKNAISGYVSSYNKGLLVNKVLEQTLIPTWVLNQHMYQEALNTQVELMRNSHSDKVRCDAANSILTHLKRPEEKALNINFGIAESSAIISLEQNIAKLAEVQMNLIEGGIKTSLIASTPIEVVDAEEVK